MQQKASERCGYLIFLTCKGIEDVRRTITYIVVLILGLPCRIHAQHVVYSENFNTRASGPFRVIGKSENFYWAVKLQKQKSNNRYAVPEIQGIQSFQLFDAKLSLLREAAPAYIPGTLKQWLLAGNHGLDQVMVTRSAGKTKILCSRFPVEDTMEPQVSLIDSLPFSADPSCLLLVRSEDQSRLLLIAFENTDAENTRVHTLLFDSDWNPVYHQVISSSLFSQPCIQDDEIGFPAESFDNLPIKLANNGEWLMASLSRISQNFSLFHDCPNGSDFYFREIPLTPFYKMQDIAMSINNEQEEMSVGFLSGYRNTSLKNVQVCNYSMKQGRFDFDSSYHFNTRARDTRSKTMSHERFMAVPGGGYLLMKEYGYAFDEFNKPGLPFFNPWETAYLLANYRETNPDKAPWNPGYTSEPGLSPIPMIRNRGDLNIFYFPAISGDSTWSGILDMEQHAESNNPDLSYLMIPAKNKLYIIYNSQEGSSDPLATTTTLNRQGQVTDDALVFWRMNKMLDFQNAHRVTAGEVAVPYRDNPRSGFAIIRLF